MQLGYDLKIEQRQSLVMTPELVQAIQILQFSRQELERYVEEQLINNPVLEAEPPEKNDKTTDTLPLEVMKEHLKESDYDYAPRKQGVYNQEEMPLEQLGKPEQVTLSEHLAFQLQFVTPNTQCRKIGRYIIDSLDESGYLTLEKQDIARVLEEPEEKVEKVLKVIQTFDPVGIAARNLEESLLMQLKQKKMYSSSYDELLKNHLEDLAENRLNQIAKAMDLSVGQVQHMRDVIRTLDPRPGGRFSAKEDVNYIVPDVIVEKISGKYVATVNETNIPKLMVSSYYRKVLAETKGEDRELNNYLEERLQAATWLLKSIEQRKQTIVGVVEEILRCQRDFFERGEKHLKSLTLKQVADELAIHESTVSRSVNGKYMQCPRGVFELKYFFSAGVEKAQGETIASAGIKSYIKEMVEQENKKKPRSDEKIVGLLQQKGIEISRRTVAKYRDEMGIPSSTKRKRY